MLFVFLVVCLLSFAFCGVQVKVSLCGEERAAGPIKAEDARKGLDLQFLQIVPGSRDREGRRVSVGWPGLVWHPGALAFARAVVVEHPPQAQ